MALKLCCQSRECDEGPVDVQVAYWNYMAKREIAWKPALVLKEKAC